MEPAIGLYWPIKRNTKKKNNAYNCLLAEYINAVFVKSRRIGIHTQRTRPDVVAIFQFYFGHGNLARDIFCLGQKLCHCYWRHPDGIGYRLFMLFFFLSTTCGPLWGRRWRNGAPTVGGAGCFPKYAQGRLRRGLLTAILYNNLLQRLALHGLIDPSIQPA